jgi:hypothetical protein
MRGLRSNRWIRAPKWLLPMSVLATHNVILSPPLTLFVPAMCLTILHNVQYHRIVRFYNVNKYREPNLGEWGLAGRLTTSLPLFALSRSPGAPGITLPRAGSLLIPIQILSFTLGASSGASRSITTSWTR